MSQILQGKTAVITGAASGIGLATSQLLMENGATVVMVDRNRAALDEIVAGSGGRAIAQVTDLLDGASCDTMVPEILAKVDHIDILYCNAGIYIGGDLVETNAARIDQMLNLNVNAVIKNVHAVLPHMIERGGGDIVVTSSIAGHVAVKPEPVYSASKWAVTCFTQTVRRQVIQHGIRVSQVSPGPVDSALLSDWPQERLQEIREAGAVMEAREVAEAVLYILSRPRNITVHDILVMPTNIDV